MGMRRSAIVFVICSATLAGSRNPSASDQLGMGRPPTADQLKAIDIEVLPDGRGLPAGSGTAERGKTVYANRCVSCHGATGKEGPQDVLVGGQGTLASAKPLKTVGSYWPYATTLWDYINRAMPFDHPGTLPPEDGLATPAYLLYLNALAAKPAGMVGPTRPAVRL